MDKVEESPLSKGKWWSSFGAIMRWTRKSSALGPFLVWDFWIFLAFVFTPSDVQLWGVSLKAVAFLMLAGSGTVTLLVGVFFAFTNPRFLQSESFHLSMRKMDMVASQGTPEIPINQVRLTEYDVGRMIMHKKIKDVAAEGREV